MRTKHYNTSEAAALLGCSTNHIYQLLKDGRLKGYKHRTGKWLIARDQEAEFTAIRAELQAYNVSHDVVLSSKPKEGFTRYISDAEHYHDIFNRMNEVKYSLKITSADLKNFNVYLDDDTPIKFCDFLLSLLHRGIHVQLLCMHPFSFYRWVNENLPELLSEPGLEIRQNDHVHMKVFIFDDECAYIGSANLTGAAIGRRSSRQRNYEAGVLVQNNDIFEAASAHFKAVWEAPENLKSTWERFRERSKTER